MEKYEENLYELNPRPPPTIRKEPLYVSKYSENMENQSPRREKNLNRQRQSYNFRSILSPEYDEFTVKHQRHATMGQTKEQMWKSPKDFLKKGSRCGCPENDTCDSPRKDSCRRSQSTRRSTRGSNLEKPPVPSRVVSKTPTKSSRNFIYENWKNAPKTKQLHPEQPERYYTDKQNFGKVPKYLSRVKKEYQAEGAYWQEMRESLMPHDTEMRCRLLSDDERLGILNGLHKNYSELKSA